jgi:hypothetical protein
MRRRQLVSGKRGNIEKPGIYAVIMRNANEDRYCAYCLFATVERGLGKALLSFTVAGQWLAAAAVFAAANAQFQG